MDKTATSNNAQRTAFVPTYVGAVDRPLHVFPAEQRQRVVEYKALAMVRDMRLATLAYEVKRTRAFFDPKLGPNGGWRCPVGTRYGGQITDRFGRNCGWGVARRLANAVVDAGERVEGRLDRRRERRVARRNARVARRLGVPGYTLPGRRRGGRPGAATRMEGLADRLDGGEGRPSRRRRGPGAATRMEGLADRLDGGEGRPSRRRRGRGAATRMEDAADRLDGGEGRPSRRRRGPGAATRMEGLADRLDGGEGRPSRRRRRRGAATRMEDAADRLDGGEGRPPRRPNRPPRRRRQRTEAIASRATNRPSRSQREASKPAGTPPPRPVRRRRGPLVDVDGLNTQQRNRLNNELDADKKRLDAEWRKRLGGKEPTIDEIDRYVQAREGESRDPRYRARLRAMRSDWQAYAAAENDEEARKNLINELGPTRRKRIMDKVESLPKRPAPGRRQPRRQNNEREANRSAESSTSDVPDGVPSGGDAPAGPNAPPEEPEPIKPARGMLQRIAGAAKAKLGRRNKQGYAIPQRVEVGNKGLTTQAKANKHVADGGDLIDVPDDFLAKSIMDNSGVGKRFEQIGAGGGINGMRRYRDSVTGKNLGIKFPRGGSYGMQEDINELVGFYIAERMGFAQGVARVGGKMPDTKPALPNVNDKSHPLVVELADEVIGDDWREAGRLYRATKVPDRDLVRMQLLDFVIINSDRHGSNFFVVRRGGKEHLYPIDMGLGFNGRPENTYGKVEGSERGLRRWNLHHAGGGRNGLRKEIRLRGDIPEQRARLRQEIIALQRELKQKERQVDARQPIEEILANVPRQPITDSGRNHFDAVERLKWIMNADPDSILDAMMARP